MAYEKQTWVTGEIVTSQKMNHMEEGILNASKGSGLCVIEKETVFENLTVSQNDYEYNDSAYFVDLGSDYNLEAGAAYGLKITYLSDIIGDAGYSYVGYAQSISDGVGLTVGGMAFVVNDGNFRLLSQDEPEGDVTMSLYKYTKVTASPDFLFLMQLCNDGGGESIEDYDIENNQGPSDSEPVVPVVS